MVVFPAAAALLRGWDASTCLAHPFGHPAHSSCCMTDCPSRGLFVMSYDAFVHRVNFSSWYTTICSPRELLVVSYDAFVHRVNCLVVAYDKMSAFSSFSMAFDGSTAQRLRESVVNLDWNARFLDFSVISDDVFPHRDNHLPQYGTVVGLDLERKGMPELVPINGLRSHCQDCDRFWQA